MFSSSSQSIIVEPSHQILANLDAESIGMLGTIFKARKEGELRLNNCDWDDFDLDDSDLDDCLLV